MNLKKRINKFIEEDLNNQYQTNVEIDDILNELNIKENSKDTLAYYKKLASQYFRLTKLVVATCLILVLTIVCAFTIKQNQLTKIIRDQINFPGLSIKDEHGLTDDEFEKLRSKCNRISKTPICSLQNISNVCIYIYHGNDKDTSNYFMLIDFLESPSEPIKIFVNHQEVVTTQTRFVDLVLTLDLSQEDGKDYLDFVVEYQNTSQRFVVFSEIYSTKRW